MPPKKRKGVAPSTTKAVEQAPLDPRDEVMVSYRNRPIVTERGVCILGPYEAYFRAYDWIFFLSKFNQPEGIKSWVYEFYTALHYTQKNQIQFLGKTVDLSPLTINRVHKLKVLGDDQFTAFTKSKYDVQEVMVELTGRRQHLKEKWKHIEKQWLTPKARYLNLILSAHLMPTTSQSLVTKRRVELLYAMSKGMSINVGRVINAELKLTLTPRKATQAIGFPSLITKLCSAAGFERVDDPRETISLMTQLSWATFQKKISTSQEASSSRPPPNEEEPTQGNTNEPPSPTPSGSDSDSDMSKLFDDLSHLDDLIRVQDRGRVRIEQRQVRLLEAVNSQREAIQHLQDQFSDFTRYQVAFNEFLVSGRPGPPPTFPLPRELPPPSPQ